VLNGLQDIPVAVRENTIVVFFSDQGFKLGEHRLYCVRCLFDADLQTQVMIRDPSNPGSFGKSSYGLFDLVDVYPTLVTLATQGMHSKPPGLEGIDQSLVMNNEAGKNLRQFSFSQIPNCNETAGLYRFNANVLPLPDWSNYMLGNGR
jgi:arylsulfatase A-like enzyme